MGLGISKLRIQIEQMSGRVRALHANRLGRHQRSGMRSGARRRRFSRRPVRRHQRLRRPSRRASCAISVTFTPAAAGPVNGTLTIGDNSGNLGATQSIRSRGPLQVTNVTTAAPFSQTNNCSGIHSRKVHALRSRSIGDREGPGGRTECGGRE